MYPDIRLVTLIILFALSGCQSEAPPAAPAPDPAPEASVPPAPAAAPDQAATIVAVLADPERSTEHRERDARSKPDVILGLLDLQPGQHVVDLLGGGGYYTELMAGIVGEGGEVILQNNTPYNGFVGEQMQERYVDNTVPGIVYLKSEVDDLQLAPNSLDAALMVMSYHDLHVYNPDRGWGRTDVGLFFAQVHEALKPGGKLLIVDHSAADGTGKEHAQDIHRIDQAFAQQEIESNGFRLVTTSDALRNPEDDRTKMVFDKSIRGKTDRFILLFAKE